MYITLHPTYTLRVEVQDRPRDPGYSIAEGETISGRQFSDPMTGKTGCDEVVAAVNDALTKAGIKTFRVALDRYEQRSSI